MFRNGHLKLAGDVFGNAAIKRFELRDTLSEMFELTVQLYDADANVDAFAVVGKAVTATMNAEPFITRVCGIVRTLRQLSSVPIGEGVFLYEVSIVPELWLTTRRRDNRIFRDATALDIINQVVSAQGLDAPVLRVNAPPPQRDYCVQYDETNYDFIMRLLAEEGITSFFDHGSDSKWTLTDDTTSGTSQLCGQDIPLRAASSTTRGPHVTEVAIRSSVETSAVTLRDWDYTHPNLMLASNADPPAGPLFDGESDLRSYHYAVGQFVSVSDGTKLATRQLQGARALRRVLDCTPSFLAPAATYFTIADHPRSDVNVPVLVVRSTMIVDGKDEATYEIECIERTVPFRPPLRPKPRIYGTQTALVVTDGESEDISVDSLGRVKVLFRWDERDDLNGDVTRWVRVSQGWASSGFGFTMLPRRGDEVIVAYLDGDPDEPIIVGRVHNATYVPPLTLPDEKTRSIWRSRSSPAPATGAAGFNEIMMEDKSGAELLEMHAERDYNRRTNRNEAISVGGSQSTSVVGSESHTAHDVSITAGTDFIHATAKTEVTIEAQTKDITATAQQNVTITATLGDLVAHALKNTGLSGGATMAIKSPVSSLHGDALVAIDSGALVTISAPTITVTGSAVVNVSAPTIVVAGSSEVDIKSDGPVNVKAAGDISVNAGGNVSVNAGGDATVKAGGDVSVNAGGTVNVKGGTIKLNG